MIDGQFIDDVLCTALDSAFGGSLHWVERTFIKDGKKADYGVDCKYEVISRGGVLVVVDEDKKEHELDRARFVNAIEQWSRTNGLNPYDLDAGNIDSNDADAILQLAVFEQVVYS